MRTTTSIAAVRGFGYAGYATAAGLKRGAGFAKNVALFVAAPFIGLAYAAAFPFVAVGMLAWYGLRAARKRAGAG